MADTGKMVDLSGRVAFVTGASSGLGRHFAQTLARAGASVAVAARRVDRLETLVREIAAEGGRAAPIALDVADADAIPRAIDAAEQALGRVSILVNNAGIAPVGPALEQQREAIDAALAVNLRGPFLLACEVARRLIAAGEPGRIVNISSMGAFTFTRGQTAFYSVTKAAIARMAEVLAVEWSAHCINVNTIAPGLFRSELTTSLGGEFRQRMLENFPRRRIGEPEQLDSTLLYLLSPLSEAVTGTTIKVDDGQLSR